MTTKDMVLEGMVGVSVINNTMACIFTFACSAWLDEHSVKEVFVAIGLLSYLFMIVATIIMHRYGKAARRLTANKYREFLHLRGEQG